jgi:hypothetical protein
MTCNMESMSVAAGAAIHTLHHLWLAQQVIHCSISGWRSNSDIAPSLAGAAIHTLHLQGGVPVMKSMSVTADAALHTQHVA